MKFWGIPELKYARRTEPFMRQPLATAAISGGEGEIIVSRGQLIEIGGGFRIPNVIAHAGARLIEVGTTNRTRLQDYRAAVGPHTYAILRVHPSNFRTVGFSEEVAIEPLCSLDVPVIDDVGSGSLADAPPVLAQEPGVRRSIRAGAALVCFSGDKLLGGPQAGILLGRREAVTPRGRIRWHGRCASTSSPWPRWRRR
jgi:L-seryl-tRNA(Ser) seleniumtransferase